MIRLITIFAILGMMLLSSGCNTTGTGGGRTESCGISMRYCAPGI